MFQADKKFGPPPSGPAPSPGFAGPPARDYFDALRSQTPAGPPTPVPQPPALGPRPPAPPAAKEPGEFTRLLSGMPAAPAPGPGPSPAPGFMSQAGGPSDFTRIVGGGGAAPPPPPAALAPTSADEAQEGTKRPFPRVVVLLVALGLVFLIAVALVLHFAGS